MDRSIVESDPHAATVPATDPHAFWHELLSARLVELAAAFLGMLPGAESPQATDGRYVFYFPLDPSRRFIKRVIGLPGDTVEARDGAVYVNGAALDEPYLAAAPRYSGYWQVAPDSLFVLGDNRNNSDDSQNWGPLPVSEVIGKAVLVYWPLPDVGLIPHYSLVTSPAG